MDVVLGMGRDIKIDDHINMRDVQTSTSHICSNQDGTTLAAKFVEGTQSFRLTQFAMKRNGMEPEVPQ